MKITVEKTAGSETMTRQLEKLFTLTRFSVQVNRKQGTRKDIIHLRNIRLKESKPYCGNHPGSCDLRPVRVKPRQAPFLEGTDWIAFNDLVNTFCDAYGISAKIESSVCIIRDGNRRRIEYSSRTGKWEKKGEMTRVAYTNTDWRMSDYPSGTPGEYNVFLNAEHYRTWKSNIEVHP